MDRIWTSSAARALGVAAAMAALAVAAGCGRGSSTAARDHGAADGGSGYADGGADRAYAAERRSSYGGREAAAARAPVPLFHGEPMWSDNRQHTAQENAAYHCNKSGPDIGAKSLDDCLTKVHHFLDHPPPGALKRVRANGDRLIYDPKNNLFAVARKDGAPRTFFKPREGMAYWREQQSDEGGYGGRRRYGSGGGYGAGSGD